MRIEEIEAFLAVVQYGSISSAAEKLFLTQSSVSRQVNSLEEELGVRLLERQKGIRKTTLTGAGQTFVLRARRLLQEMNETKTTVRAAERPIVTFGCMQSVLPVVAVDVNQAVHSMDCPCSFSIRGMRSAEIYPAVEAREIDFGMAALEPDHKYRHTVNRLLFTEKMVFVSRKDSPYGDEVRVSDLDIADQIMTVFSAQQEMWQMYWFGAAGEPFLHTQNSKIYSEFFTSPEKWCVLPISVAATVRNVRFSEMDYLPDPRPMYLVHPYAVVSPFLETILQVVKKTYSAFDGVQMFF